MQHIQYNEHIFFTEICCLIRSIFFFFPLTACLFCGGWCKWMALLVHNQGVSNRKESRSNHQLCKCDSLLSFLLIANQGVLSEPNATGSLI